MLSQEPWKTLIAVALGWLLGLLSTVGIQYWTKRKERRDLKAGIAVELTNILFYLVSTVYLATANLHGIDKDLLSWTCGKLNLIKDKLSKLELGLLERSEKTLAVWNDQWRTRPSTGEKGLNVRKVNTPFLDLKFGVLPSLKTDVQNRLIKIVQRIDTVNQLVVKMDFYHAKTFEALTSENHEIVKKNYDDSLGYLVTQSRMLANDISEVLPLLERSWLCRLVAFCRGC